jgi:hypothetical protein
MLFFTWLFLILIRSGGVATNRLKKKREFIFEKTPGACTYCTLEDYVIRIAIKNMRKKVPVAVTCITTRKHPFLQPQLSAWAKNW